MDKLKTFKVEKGTDARHPEEVLDRSSIAGFTLIDMAIALMVIGLLVAPALYQYKVWNEKRAIDITDSRINSINEAIRVFYYENGRYPCPANPDLDITDASYGEEYLQGGGGTCRNSMRLAGNDAYEGIPPIQALRLTPEDTLDGWNKKLVYAVTKSHADPVGGDPSDTVANPPVLTVEEYKSTQGVDGAICPDITNPAQRTDTLVHYVVLSLGPDWAGPHYKNNSPGPACPAATGFSGFEKNENCDGDTTYLSSICTRNPNTSAALNTHFDDMLSGGENLVTKVPSDFWDIARSGTSDMGSNAGFIGIGTKTPEYEMDVRGNIKADNKDPADTTTSGDLHANQFCDESGTNCFNPAVIAGSDPNMECPPEKRGMTGLGSNQAKCNVGYPNFPGRSCPAGLKMTGMTATKICCNHSCIY
ncbi:MAG: hypothetical protein KDJ75_06110 [Alphaproteobacteria bacterium]|nr:hypothetical protein [Alphaproteobacteria bacterium]